MFTLRVDNDLSLALPEHHMAEALTVLVRENLDRLRPWMPWAVDEYSVDMARAFIKRSLQAYADNGRFEACIVEKGNVIGTIGFHNYESAHRSAHIGYWIDRRSEGKGIVTRCCKALIDHLFDDLQLNRIQINCNVENARSRAVPERLGFTLEGIQRQVEFLHDRFGDWAVYALLRDEWSERQSRD